MTTTLERLDLAAAGFRRRLDGLSDADLAAASPCEGWSARDVVTHTIDAVVMVSDFVGEPTDDDPDGALLARFDAAIASLRAKVEDPELGTTVVQSPFGDLALKQLVSSIVVHDLLVHTWDLARATGGDEELDPELCAHTLEAMGPMDDQLRGHGFAEKVPAAAGADVQTEMLNFLGRRP